MRITQVKSQIGYCQKTKGTIEALGLRMGRTVEMPDNPAIRGMLRKIRHLVRVEEN